MKEISWTEFKKQTLKEMESGECCKVTGDGDMKFYAVIKPEGVMKDRIEANCDMIDKSRGL